MYKFIQAAYYHPKGVKYKLEPSFKDFFITICPFFNTIACIFMYIVIVSPLKSDGYNTENYITNFFKPKDKNK